MKPFQIVKCALSAGLLCGATSVLAGAAHGPVTLLYAGHFFYTPVPVTLIVRLNDPSNEEFNLICNSKFLSVLIEDPATSNVANADALIYQSQLQSAYAMGSDITIDYSIDTNYQGTGATACIISSVYSGTFD